MANKTKTQPKKSVIGDEVRVESLGDGAVKMPRQSLTVQLATETLNEENRTIDATFYSGAQVMRMNWWTGEKWMLQFSMDPSHIRMDRLNSGAPVLNMHSDWDLSDILGVVEKGWLEDGKGKVKMRFSDREDVGPVWGDVKNKIIRNVSMGAAVHKLKDVTPDESKIKHYLAVDWEPMEVSVVGIGADPGAGFLKAEHEQFTTCEVEHAEQRATAQKENLMEEQLKDTGSAPVVEAREEPKKATNTDPTPAVDLAAIKAEAKTDERLRIDGIQKAIQLANSKLGAKLDEVFCQRLISNGTSVADARTEIFNKLAEQSETNPIRTANVQVTRDADVTRIDAMSNQLLHRLGPDKVKLESGRQYVNYTLFDLTKEVLSAHGISFSGKSKLDVVDLAYQTTSDFPNLIGDVAHRRLRQAYEEVLPTYRLWARRAPNAPDFKSMTVIQLGGAPDLLRVNEHGEFQYAKVSDGAETYNMVTYGRILAFTRQAIINDDLRGFDRITTGFGSAAARLENRTVYAELTANAALSDGVALFHATHGNLVTGPGTVINVANLGIARGKMRAQVGVNGEALNLVPRYLIVPAALEQVAYQYTSNQFVPATPANTNEFRQGGRTALEVIVDGLLDATSTTAWYLAADSSAIDTVEYAFLDGNEGVFLEQRKGFNIDGMEFKARLDFAAKNLDFRGLVRNDGA